MNRTILNVETADRPADKRFHFRDFRRMVALVAPYRRKLAIGILLTLLFATLHTFSLAGAFPVFQVMLGTEGLGALAQRKIAEQRLGLEFAPVREDDGLRVVRLHGAAARHAPGVIEADMFLAPEGSATTDLLAQLADAPPSQPLDVAVRRGAESLTLVLAPKEWSTRTRLARIAAAFIPAGSDTSEGKLRALMIVLAAVLACVLVSNVSRYFGEAMIADAVLSGLISLRVQLYERTLRLPLSFFAAQPTADIVTRFVQDVQEIQRGLLTLFGKFIREPIKAAMILLVAMVLDWRLTLTMIVVAPVTVGIFFLVGRSVKKANRKLLQGYGLMIDALTTSLQSLRVVKAYTAEDQELARLRKIDLRMFQQQLKLAKLEAFISPAVETLAVFAASILTLWLASRVINQELDLPEFLTLGFVLSTLFDPLRKMTDVYVRVQRSSAGAERIFQVLDQPMEAELASGAKAAAPIERNIEFRDVGFTYPAAERPALRGVNLTIVKGETVAVVGPNGSGKTTLVSLLLRFFDPTTGKVLYDGDDLRSFSIRSLRSQIGLVTQDAVIFAGTPLENIDYGASDSDADAARDAARRAYAEEFILNIPGGFEAGLGERGTTLSGGQRQRLAIARAIRRNAPILIFDEATSQIDSESELKIQTALRDFAKGRTTIIIAHRLSTIQFADRIVVMDSGRVLDSGAHAELFERCPLYRTLCETQLVSEAG